MASKRSLNSVWIVDRFRLRLLHSAHGDKTVAPSLSELMEGDKTPGHRTVAVNVEGQRILGLRTSGDKTQGLPTPGERIQGLSTWGDKMMGDKTVGERMDGLRILGYKMLGDST